MAEMTDVAENPRFRDEIQGLRAAAALMIAVYHIWFDKVSGGVDVFFVVSGFLILGSLTRESAARGSIGFTAFYTRIARRILPLTCVVIAVSVVGIVVFMSRLYWGDAFAGVRAAVFHTANVHFGATSVEYLAQDANTSPVQHLWATSIQVQFYLVAPIFVTVASFVARRFGWNRHGFFVFALIVATVSSFVYSVIATPSDPASMYFDSFARMWEFGVGGLIAVALATWSIPSRIARVMAWAGVGIVFLNAAVVGGGDYPGWIALVPVSGAVLVLLAGQTDSLPRPIAILGSRMLVRLGDYSFGFFLWHWPILIFGKLHYGVDEVSLLGGLVIIVVSFVSAVVTHRIVEMPFLRIRVAGRSRPVATELLAASLVIAALPLVTLAVQGTVRGDLSGSSNASDVRVPDEVVVPTAAESDLFDPARALRPDPIGADDDRGQTSVDGCFKKNNSTSRVEICSYGDPTGPTVALVGGSHSLQWAPALKLVAEKHRWKLDVVAKVTCRFGAINEGACGKWVANVERQLTAEPPSVVVLTATVASSQNERVPSEYVDRWETLDGLGVPVVAIRDNPWFPYSVPACVDANRSDPSPCAHPRDELLLPENPALEVTRRFPSMNVVDFTDYLCDATVCHGVIDNIVTYRDRDHLTATFVERLAPVMEKEMLKVLESNAPTDSSAEAG